MKLWFKIYEMSNLIKRILLMMRCMKSKIEVELKVKAPPHIFAANNSLEVNMLKAAALP